MKFVIDNWSLILLMLVSGGLLIWPALAKSALGSALSPSAAVQLINREKAVVVDVSDAADFSAGHVSGARHVPLDQVNDKLADAVKNKAVPLILVCPTGARAGKAAALARKLGYDKAQPLAGGLRAWREANLPLEKA